MPRSLNDWVDYIQTLHPRSIEMGLERVAEVWGRMACPDLPPLIAVAGTNGKGSSVSMLESVYRHAGYRTGSFTSPHLQHFNERICLDNIPADDALLLRAFEYIEVLRAETRLTFFEYNVLLALHVFCTAKLDIIILEVGMGGRLDAVNMVQNQLALITAIDLDHCSWLGDTREQIAVEKAGIIKSGGMAVIADPLAPQLITKIAQQQHATFLTAEQDYQLRPSAGDELVFHSGHAALSEFSGMTLPAAPLHQCHNMAGVIASVALMNPYFNISREQVEMGLNRQFLRGRLQFIEGAPNLLLDVSHNDQSLSAMLAYIEGLKVDGEIHAVFGALADKRYEGAFAGLKKCVSHWYLCSLEGPRGQSSTDLKDAVFGAQAQHHGSASVALFADPGSAMAAAKQTANSDDLIVIFGSFHVVGAIIGDLND